MFTSHQRLFVGGFLLGILCLAWPIHTESAAMAPEKYFSEPQLTAYRVAQVGQSERLVAAVKAGTVDLNLPGREDMTLLALAVLLADQRAIATLMRAGADPDQPIRDVGSPAVMAIAKHANPPRTDALAGLVEGGYDLNRPGARGKPYIFYFVDYNHWLGLRYALEHGANINARSRGGESLLAYVIEGGDLPQARILINAGADVSLKGKRNESALSAIENNLRMADPTQRKIWDEMVALRELILSRLPEGDDRRTVFTDLVEPKIRAAGR